MINSDTSESLFRSFPPPPPLSCILPLFTGQETLRASQQHHVSYNISLPDTFSPFSSVTLLQLRFFSLPYVAAGEKSGCLSLSCSSFAPFLSSPSPPFSPFSPSSPLVLYLPFSSHPRSSSLCIPHFPLPSSMSHPFSFAFSLPLLLPRPP